MNKSRDTYICSALFVIAAIFILAAQPYVSSFYGSKPSFWLHIISYCAMAVTVVLGIKEVDILACVFLVITAVLSAVICVTRGSRMMGAVIVFFDAGALLLLASSVYSKMKYLSYAAAAVSAPHSCKAAAFSISSKMPCAFFSLRTTIEPPSSS